MSVGTLSPFTVYETLDKQDVDYVEKAKSGDYYINLDEGSFVKNCLFVYDSQHTDCCLPAIGSINGQPIVRLKHFVIAHKSKFSKETLDKLENVKSDETI